MPHVRTAIRDDLITTLTGLTTTGARVYPSRVYPIQSSALPGLVIYTKSESADYATMTMGSGRTILRTLTAAIEAYVKGVTGYDDDIDDITAEVEVALAADPSLGGLAKDTRLISIEVEYSGEGDQPIAACMMNVEIDYTTSEGSPTV